MPRNTKFNCIEKWVKEHSGYKIYEFPNNKDNRSYVVVWTTDIKKFWGFFENFAFGEYNEYMLGKTPIKIGKWKCDGLDNFMFTAGVNGDGYPISPSEYHSKDNFAKKDISSEPEQTPATAEPVEPTYDKSKFPLGIGSEGPEVAQLQNYLNRLIPNEPLVVNGRFDVKTADKLKQLQKSLNINK